MTDLYRGHDLTTIVDKVDRAYFAQQVPQGDYDAQSAASRQANKAVLLPVITATVDAIEADGRQATIRSAAMHFLHSEDPESFDLTDLALALGEDPNDVEAIVPDPKPKPLIMREYDYTYSTDEAEQDPRHYENQMHQHDLHTCTTWVMHTSLRPEHLDDVLTTILAMSWAVQITGEYTYGDSFIEWTSPTDDDDDRHLAVYFDAPDKDKALEDGRLLAAVALRKDGEGSIPSPVFHVSTSGDYSQQVSQA